MNDIERLFKQLQDWIKNIERGSIDRDKHLAERLQNIVRRQSLHEQLSVQEQQRRILAEIYRGASSYTNLVILAGYAGIFGLWQLMKGHIPPSTAYGVGLLTALSLIGFVGFEVMKMIQQAIFFIRLNKVIGDAVLPPEDRIRAWELAIEENFLRDSKFWPYFLVPTVLTGFGAAAWLLVTFVRELWGFIP